MDAAEEIVEEVEFGMPEGIELEVELWAAAFEKIVLVELQITQIRSHLILKTQMTE